MRPRCRPAARRRWRSPPRTSEPAPAAMAQPLLDAVAPAAAAGVGDGWQALAECRARVPASLVPWLAEPGLLTARVRAACGAATRLRMLRLEPAPLDPGARTPPRRGRRDLPAARDRVHLRRAPLDLRAVGVAAVHGAAAPLAARARRPRPRRVAERRRGRAPRAARVPRAARRATRWRGPPAPWSLAAPLWARRAVYRLGGWPILVQEVFLPALGRCD